MKSIFGRWISVLCIATVSAQTGDFVDNRFSGGLSENFDINNPQNVLKSDHILKNEAHIREHLKDEIKVDEKKMTPEQLEFHYFRTHDFNKDYRLDGIELLHALDHMVSDEELEAGLRHGLEGKSDEEVNSVKKRRHQYMKDYYTATIDKILADDDLDDDGYLTYPEYASSRRRQEEAYAEQVRQIENDPEKLKKLKEKMEKLQQDIDGIKQTKQQDL